MPLNGYFDHSRLYQTLSVARKTRVFDGDGGWTDAWAGTGATFKGVLAEATTREIMLGQQLQYPVTHAILAEGPPVADVGQRLILGSLSTGQAASPTLRKFQIQNVDDAGELGVMTVYHAEEVKS